MEAVQQTIRQTVPRTRQQARRPSFPRLPLYSAFALILFAIGAIIFGERTGIGTVMTETGTPVDIIDLTLSQEAGDRVLVKDAVSGKVIADFGPGEGGFIRGSMRALARMRMTAEAETNAPYRLIKWTSGALSLSDTATGQRIYLNAFGPDQVAAFEKLLDPYGRTAQ
jgi:putative photosynthetic complex assembly protein